MKKRKAKTSNENAVDNGCLDLEITISYLENLEAAIGSVNVPVVNDRIVSNNQKLVIHELNTTISNCKKVIIAWKSQHLSKKLSTQKNK